MRCVVGTVKTYKCFLKFNNNDICIDSFKNYNHLHISKPIINRQKQQFKKKILRRVLSLIRKKYSGRHVQTYTRVTFFIKKFEMGRNLQ